MILNISKMKCLVCGSSEVEILIVCGDVPAIGFYIPLCKDCAEWIKREFKEEEQRKQRA